MDFVKQGADLVDQHEQHHDQSCQGGHQSLVFPPGTNQNLIQNGDYDPDGGDLEDEFYPMRVVLVSFEL